MLGGHSGDDIDKGRGNANKILNRFLWTTHHKVDLHISTFNGGNLRNAIAREAYTVIVVPSDQKESLAVLFNHFRDDIEDELFLKEPKIKLKLESCDIPKTVIDQKCQSNLLNSIYACPHGVLAMSAKMPGLVETSTNLASVKFKENNMIEIVTSQRSDLASGKSDAANMIEAVFKM